MNDLVSWLLESALFERIALTVIHFVWQGMLVSAFVWLAGIALRKKSANARYNVFVAGLVSMAACAAATFIFVEVDVSSAAISSAGKHSGAATSTASHSVGFSQNRSVGARSIADSESKSSQATADRTSAATTTPSISIVAIGRTADLQGVWRLIAAAIATAYFVGVVIVLGRLLLGLRGGWSLRLGSQPVDNATLLSSLARRAQVLEMRVAPALCYCRDIAVPTVVGILRPTILLPLSLAAGLKPDELEAILTHELAHIRRRDHLVNVLQRVIEAVLFFHPAVWWMSRRIRIERENCCDDLVVRLGAEPVRYAELLVDIAEHGRRRPLARKTTLVAALQATAGNSQVALRVKRLLGDSTCNTFRLNRSGVLATLVTTAMLLFATMALMATPQDESPQKQPAAEKGAPKDVAAGKQRSPRETVAEFLRLIKHGPDRRAWDLAAPDSHVGWGPELKDLREFDRIRPLHLAAGHRRAVVISNPFVDNHDRQQVFYATLQLHEGKWLIYSHGISAAEDANRVLRGFALHPSTKFDVIPAELVGRWRVNVCQCSLTLSADGTGGELAEGPGGPEPGAQPEPFKWRIAGNTFVKEFADRKERWSIEWVDDDAIRMSLSDKSATQGWDRVGELAAVVPPQNDDKPANQANQAKLEFLADVVEFRALDMQITEAKLKQHIAKHKLDANMNVTDRITSYRLYNRDGECVVVMFRRGKCSCIQRMRADPSFKAKRDKPADNEGAARDAQGEQFLLAVVDEANPAALLQDAGQDPLRAALRIDDERVAAVARKTQQDTELVSRVCRRLGLSDVESAAVAGLARQGKLAALNFELIEKIEASPRDFKAAVGFSKDEQVAFDAMMKRTGHRTLTVWQLARDDKLTMIEQAAAETLRRVATIFLVNHESLPTLSRAKSLSNAEKAALAKLAAAVERQFQSLYLAFFSC